MGTRTDTFKHVPLGGSHVFSFFIKEFKIKAHVRYVSLHYVFPAPLVVYSKRR